MMSQILLLFKFNQPFFLQFHYGTHLIYFNAKCVSFLLVLNLFYYFLFINILFFSQFPIFLHYSSTLLCSPNLIIKFFFLDGLLFQFLKNQILSLLNLKIVLKIGLFYYHFPTPILNKFKYKIKTSYLYFFN